MINNVLLSLGLTICFFDAGAQKATVLETYVEEGLGNNLSLKTESLEIRKAAEAIRQAKALFYPRATFSPTYSYAAGGRRLDFPVGDLLNPAYKSLNELTGKNQFPTNIENVNVLLAPSNFHDTKINIQYAVYNPEVRYNYLIQKNLLSAQEARKQVVENEIRYAIQTAYYQYLQSLEAVKILGNSRKVLEELLRLNKKLVANQVITKDAIFSSEYEVSKLSQQLSEAGKNTRIAQAYFNFLLNRPLDIEIIADTLLLNQNGGELLARLSDLPELTARATDNRQELKQLDMSVEAAQNAVRLNQLAASRPSVFIGGNAGFQGYGYTFRNQAYLVGQIGLNWDLFKGFERKSKIQQAKIQTDLLKTRQSEVEKQIELQTAQAYYDLVSTREAQMAAESGYQNAGQYFKLVDSRYRNGNVLLLEYIKAQNDIVTAQLQQSITKFDVFIKKAMLDKVTAQR